MTPMKRSLSIPSVFLPVLSVFLFSMAFLFAAQAHAAYRIYLKNGSVISGVGSYARSDGNIEFSIGGGTVGIPVKDIAKIEKYEEEGGTVEAPAYAPPAKEKNKTTPQAGQPGPSSGQKKAIRDRLAGINRRLEKIKEKEAEYQKLKDQYQEVMLRIQNLFNQGRQRAIAAGESPLTANQQYLQFLTPEEHQMVQANFLEKQDLEEKIKDMETNVLPRLKEEKQRLLDEKQQAEAQLGG